MTTIEHPFTWTTGSEQQITIEHNQGSSPEVVKLSWIEIVEDEETTVEVTAEVIGLQVSNPDSNTTVLDYAPYGPGPDKETTAKLSWS